MFVEADRYRAFFRFGTSNQAEDVAERLHNRRACSALQGIGGRVTNKQSAKGATFALLATMLRGWFRENREPCSRKKEISFRENFWPRNPSKTVILRNRKDTKMPTKPYAATLSEVFKT